jgi:tetratricopeptide (TPR) repeat protein
MRPTRVCLFVLAAILALTSCNRDPNVAKKRYLESGNKYFEKGKYKEARIMYLDAKKKDPRYGPAYYRLGLTAIKLGSLGEAVQALRRAIELIGEDLPDHWDAVVKLSEIYLSPAGRQQKEFLDEVQGFCDRLLKRDPNSFDGHRLTGDLTFLRASVAFNSARKEEGRKLIDAALAQYRQADAVKPGDQGVSVQLARTLAAKGDFAGAEAAYRGVIERDKKFLNGYAELYNLFMFQQKPDEGERILKLAFQNNPTQYAFLQKLALHYYVQSRREDMLGVIRQIKSHAKDYDRAYLDAGDFYLRLGDGDSAIKEYREGMGADAKKKVTYQKRIIEVLMRQGKRSEAAEINAQILKDDPKDNDARGLAATMLLEKGEVSKALSELQSVVTRDPTNPVSHYNLGRAYAAHAEYPLAQQQFQKAVDLRPDYVMARLALVQLQIAMGQFDAALKGAQDVLAIDRNNLSAQLVASAALMGQRKFPESRQVLENLLKTNPGSPDVYYQLGIAGLSESKFKDAEDAFRHAYQLNPANPRGLMGMVETAMAQNKPEQALALLQAESDKAPNRQDLVLAMGNTAARAGHYDQAIGCFQKVLNGLDKNSKQRGDLYLRIGETLRRKGDLAGAVAQLQKARELMPDNAGVLSTLAMVLDSAGRWSEARQVYEANLKINPNDGIALNNLAFVIAEHGGDLDDALTKATRAKQIYPNLAEVSDTLGWIYLKKNLSDNAIDIFRDLVQKVPTVSTYRYHLGMALFQKGDKPRALKELQEALKFNPKKEEREKIQALIGKLG